MSYYFLYDVNTADENNNSYPTNSDYHQVILNLLALRTANVEPVRMSNYLNIPKWFGIRFRRCHFQNKINKILKLLPDLTTPREDNYSVVFCWDIKEITMLASNCIQEFSIVRPDINSRSLFELLNRILMSLNFTGSREHGSENIVTIEDALNEKGIAPKYTALTQLYNDISNGRKTSIISKELIKRSGMSGQEKELCEAAEQIQKFIVNERWKCVKRSLKLVNRRCAKSQNKKFANVVVSEEGIEVACGELLISGLAKQFPIENVYSRLNVSEETVLRRIQQRFGENCVLVYVKTPSLSNNIDRWEKLMLWPVEGKESIDWLYEAQRDYFLE